MPPAPAETLLLRVGALGMALATLGFAAVRRGETDRPTRRFLLGATVVPAVTAAAYAATAAGAGIATVRVGGSPVPLYWARYVGWLLATPLLVGLLAALAGVDPSTVRTLAALAALTVGARLAGAATPRTAASVGLWAVGSAFLLALAFLLVRRLEAAAARRPDDVDATLVTLAILLVALLTGYPVVWIFGPASTLAVVDATAATAAYAVVDLLATVGFPYLLVRNRHLLVDGGGRPVAGEGNPAADGYSPR